MPFFISVRRIGDSEISRHICLQKKIFFIVLLIHLLRRVRGHPSQTIADMCHRRLPRRFVLKFRKYEDVKKYIVFS